jgi:hypothetical protein
LLTPRRGFILTWVRLSSLCRRLVMLISWDNCRHFLYARRIYLVKHKTHLLSLEAVIVGSELAGSIRGRISYLDVDGSLNLAQLILSLHISYSLFYTSSKVLRIAMRSVALSVLLALAATSVSADDSKPAFQASSSLIWHTGHRYPNFLSLNSPPRSRLRSLSSSLMTGRNVGHHPMPRRRRQSGAKPSVTWVNGKSRNHQFLSSTVTRA